MSAIDGSAVSLADLQLTHMLNGKLGLFIVQFDAKRVTRRGFLLAGRSVCTCTTLSLRFRSKLSMYGKPSSTSARYVTLLYLKLVD